MEKTEVRRCADCGCQINGRKNRRFCSDSCRVNYHNTLAQAEKPLIRKVNKILKNNRTILEHRFNSGLKQVSRHELEMLGYLFAWHTGCFNGDCRMQQVYEYTLCQLEPEVYEIRFQELFLHPVP